MTKTDTYVVLGVCGHEIEVQFPEDVSEERIARELEVIMTLQCAICGKSEGAK